MSEALQTLLLAGELKDVLFPATSRYHGIDTTSFTTADQRVVAHLRRRFVPPPERFASLQEHVIVEGDRLDNLAALHLGDPELFWQLCDANGALRPDDLTEEPGRKLRITLPEGGPGTPESS